MDSDSTDNKILGAWRDISTKLAQHEAKRERIERKIKALRADEEYLRKSLEYVGISVPAQVGGKQAVATGRPRRGVIQSILAVVSPGETLKVSEVVARIDSSDLPLQSKNPINAVSTALSRSAEFTSISRGVYHRRNELPESNDELDKPETGEAPPPGSGNGASTMI